MIITNPHDFFYNELIKNFKNTEITDSSIIYLNNFLIKSMKTENMIFDSKKPAYLGLIMKEILDTNDNCRIQELTLSLGEMALLLSSFFPQLIYKRNVNLNYYMSLGSIAYSSLEKRQKNKELKLVYDNISNNFIKVVNGLSSLNQSLVPSENILLIHDLYTETHNKKYLSELIKKGILINLK